MLDELMNGDGSPQAILQALQTALTQEDSKDGTTPDANVVAFDPQLLMLAAGSAQLGKALNAQSQNASGGTIDVNAQRGSQSGLQSGLLDLALLSASAGQAGTTVTDSLLTASSDANGKSAQDAAQNSKPADAPMPAMAAAQTDRATDVRERPQIHAHVGTPAWTDELAGKLTVMIGRGVQSASLHLSPESLGPLEVRISVQNDQTSVWFGAAHAETRAALEHALPRLRELLAGQGLNLSDAGVSQQAPRDRSKSYAASGDGRSEEREIAISSVASRGMVDAYA
jgi:flagellar hook-length control protein FliK